MSIGNVMKNKHVKFHWATAILRHKRVGRTENIGNISKSTKSKKGHKEEEIVKFYKTVHCGLRERHEE